MHNTCSSRLHLKCISKITFFSKKVQILNPVVGRGAIRVLSGVANLASHYDCSNPCSFRDITFVVIFFSKNLNYFFFKIWISISCSWVLLGYSQNLRILSPNVMAQILVVFEIWRFLWFFSKTFQKTWTYLFSSKFQILNPVVGRRTIRVLSGVANLAYHYDCSDPCSFRDITFVVIFFKKLELFFFVQNLNFYIL